MEAGVGVGGFSLSYSASFWCNHISHQSHVCGWYGTVQFGFTFWSIHSRTEHRMRHLRLEDLVVQNTLHLNDNKTEILLTGSAVGTELPSSLPEWHYIFQGTLVAFLTASSHWRGKWTNSRLVYLEIRRIGSIRQYLSFKDTQTLVSALVLAGSCPVILDKIQSDQPLNSPHLQSLQSNSVNLRPPLATN